MPVWGRSLGGGHGSIIQYSCLGNPMDREEPGGLHPRGAQVHEWVGERPCHRKELINLHNVFQTCAGLCFVSGNELVVIFSLGFLAKANSDLP